MDQSKFRIPRVRLRRFPKLMEALYRPTLHLVGCWLHGHRLDLAVADEDLKKNSETQIDIIARAIDGLFEHITLPLGFHLQQDNCYREGKNRFVVSFMVLLVSMGIFRWTSMGFLRKGHRLDLSLENHFNVCSSEQIVYHKL